METLRKDRTTRFSVIPRDITQMIDQLLRPLDWSSTWTKRHELKGECSTVTLDNKVGQRYLAKSPHVHGKVYASNYFRLPDFQPVPMSEPVQLPPACPFHSHGPGKITFKYQRYIYRFLYAAESRSLRLDLVTAPVSFDREMPMPIRDFHLSPEGMLTVVLSTAIYQLDLRTKSIVSPLTLFWSVPEGDRGSIRRCRLGGDQVAIVMDNRVVFCDRKTGQVIRSSQMYGLEDIVVDPLTGTFYYHRDGRLFQETTPGQLVVKATVPSRFCVEITRSGYLLVRMADQTLVYY